ncbi:MAG: EamA family transporter [Kibdelosporangium sp.]
MGHGAVVALLLNAIPFPLFAFGETKISSVLAGVWNATVPLATLAFALVLVPDERPSPRRLAGMATGFAGVLVVLGIWRGIEAAPWPAHSHAWPRRPAKARRSPTRGACCRAAGSP